MGILANGFRDSLGAFQIFGATVSNNAYPSAGVQNNGHRTAAMRNFISGQGTTTELIAYPSGNLHPTAWMLPQKAGALAARNSISGAGEFTSAISGGVNGEATLAGVGTLSSTLQLVVSLVASIGGSGTISGAALLAYLQLAATLAGTGDLTGARTAIAHAAAIADGTGTIAGTTTATALGELAAAITVTGTGLTTSNVGAAVWSAIAASNNDAGTMGEKLNDAGSASNPWTEVIESGYSAAQILRLIAAAVQGNATGLEDGTPTFKGLNGTTDRITATYSSGTRTVTGRDAD